jgi:soluble lytic murein transglycosylase-like protein
MSAWKLSAPAWGVPLVERAAKRSNIPAALINAVIRTESAWQPYVVSAAGAIGLMQLMPETAEQLGVDPRDPEQNVVGGSRYLRELLDAFDDVELALAAYNAGPHRVREYGGVPPFAETRAYVSRVVERLWS